MNEEKEIVKENNLIDLGRNGFMHEYVEFFFYLVGDPSNGCKFLKVIKSRNQNCKKKGK